MPQLHQALTQPRATPFYPFHEGLFRAYEDLRRFGEPSHVTYGTYIIPRSNRLVSPRAVELDTMRAYVAGALSQIASAHPFYEIFERVRCDQLGFKYPLTEEQRSICVQKYRQIVPRFKCYYDHPLLDGADQVHGEILDQAIASVGLVTRPVKKAEKLEEFWKDQWSDSEDEDEEDGF